MNFLHDLSCKTVRKVNQLLAFPILLCLFSMGTKVRETVRLWNKDHVFYFTTYSFNCIKKKTKKQNRSKKVKKKKILTTILKATRLVNCSPNCWMRWHHNPQKLRFRNIDFKCYCQEPRIKGSVWYQVKGGRGLPSVGTY